MYVKSNYRSNTAANTKSLLQKQDAVIARVSNFTVKDATQAKKLMHTKYRVSSLHKTR